MFIAMQQCAILSAKIRHRRINPCPTVILILIMHVSHIVVNDCTCLFVHLWQETQSAINHVRPMLFGAFHLTFFAIKDMIVSHKNQRFGSYTFILQILATLICFGKFRKGFPVPKRFNQDASYCQMSFPSLRIIIRVLQLSESVLVRHQRGVQTSCFLPTGGTRKEFLHVVLPTAAARKHEKEKHQSEPACGT